MFLRCFRLSPLILRLFFIFPLVGCATSPNLKKVPLVEVDHQIHFIYREWHTSILLDASAFSRYSKVLSKNVSLQTELQQKKYIRIGWGDGDYFTGKRKTFGAATKALVASDYSAIQVLGYVQEPFASIPEETRVPLWISDKSMRKLVTYFDKSFALSATREVIPLPSYAENAGAFYQAKGHYSLFSNCNTWSGRALQVAGLPVRSRLHLTAQSVFEQARAISIYQQANPTASGSDE